jgi:hypothetical protein
MVLLRAVSNCPISVEENRIFLLTDSHSSLYPSPTTLFCFLIDKGSALRAYILPVIFIFHSQKPGSRGGAETRRENAYARLFANLP